MGFRQFCIQLITLLILACIPGADQAEILIASQRRGAMGHGFNRDGQTNWKGKKCLVSLYRYDATKK